MGYVDSKTAMAQLNAMQNASSNVSNNSGATAPVVTKQNSTSMENVFDALPEYGAKWMVEDARFFNEKEQADIQSAEVVPSQFGLSVCFLMSNGKKKYIPLDQESTLNIGDPLDKSRIQLKKLINIGDTSKPIGATILRVDVPKMQSVPEEATDFSNPFGI